MTNSLVSITVRTKDRPKLLRRALQSIASQTYRPIEVVLVNDGGCDLNNEDLKSILGDVSLNYVRLEKNTGRAHAGNVGIENAKGDYIGFLDDDDELYPEHVKELVSHILQSGARIVYTEVEFVEQVMGEKGEVVGSRRTRVFGREFSYEDLLIENYVPLIAVLFASEILKELRFDESFELFEDWDLLIRAGQIRSQAILF